MDRGDRGNAAQICQGELVANYVIADQGIVQQLVRLVQVLDLVLGGFAGSVVQNGFLKSAHGLD